MWESMVFKAHAFWGFRFWFLALLFVDYLPCVSFTQSIRSLVCVLGFMLVFFFLNSQSEFQLKLLVSI